MTKREGYSKRMERKLAGWQTRFETRRAEAAKLGAALDPDERERLEAAKVGSDAAFAKLGELRAAAVRWAELRDEMEAAWRTIDDLPPEAEAEAEVRAVRQA